MKSCTAMIIAIAVLTAYPVPTCGADNQLTEEERKAGWLLLFNGTDLSGWKCNNGKEIATPIENGSLVPYKSGGNLILHEKEFADFVLKCDVRWEAERCNSGIFFRVEDPGIPVHTGFEIQVLSGDSTGTHAFGAIYDLVATSKNAGFDTGQWNTVEIKCHGPHISVKVNDQPVAEMNCDDFDKPGLCPDGKRHKYKLAGKPRAIKDFARSGYLGFQDHGEKVWYKNVKLLPLKD